MRLECFTLKGFRRRIRCAHFNCSLNYAQPLIVSAVDEQFTSILLSRFRLIKATATRDFHSHCC